MKRIILVVILMFVSALPFAYVESSASVMNAGQSVDVGNKFCPVSGDKVSGKHFAVYQGKRYSLCCPVCEKKFLKNPEKYIAKMAEQEKAPLGEAEKEGDHDHDHDHDM